MTLTQLKKENEKVKQLLAKYKSNPAVVTQQELDFVIIHAMQVICELFNKLGEKP